jgi:hypothetical protein
LMYFQFHHLIFFYNIYVFQIFSFIWLLFLVFLLNWFFFLISSFNKKIISCPLFFYFNFDAYFLVVIFFGFGSVFIFFFSISSSTFDWLRIVFHGFFKWDVSALMTRVMSLRS